MSKLKSRKLWMTVAGCVAVLAIDYAQDGRISADTLGYVIAAVIGYGITQGWVDGKKEERKE